MATAAALRPDAQNSQGRTAPRLFSFQSGTTHFTHHPGKKNGLSKTHTHTHTCPIHGSLNVDDTPTRTRRFQKKAVENSTRKPLRFPERFSPVTVRKGGA